MLILIVPRDLQPWSAKTNMDGDGVSCKALPHRREYASACCLPITVRCAPVSMAAPANLVAGFFLQLIDRDRYWEDVSLIRFSRFGVAGLRCSDFISPGMRKSGVGLSSLCVASFFSS
jgi:hypothetical protein